MPGPNVNVTEVDMGLMGKLFGTPSDPLEARASSLVDAAHLNATGAFEPLLDRHGFLSEVDREHWDFIVTVAGVFIAASRLASSGVSEDRQDRLMEVVAEKVEAWDPNGLRGFEDCRSLFEREYDRLQSSGHEPRFIASDALGIWIAWNVLGHAPSTEEEVAFVRGIGALVTHAFYDWWDNA
jgi:hypothetical protein